MAELGRLIAYAPPPRCRQWTEEATLLVGTSTGYLRHLRADGVHLASHRVHEGPVLHVAVPGALACHGPSEATATVLCADAILVTVPMPSLHAWRGQGAPAGARKWYLGGAERVVAAAWVPPPPIGLFDGAHQAYALSVLAVGQAPALALYRVPRGDAQPDIGRLASTVATKVSAAVWSLASSWWNRSAAAEEPEPAPAHEEPDSTLLRAEPDEGRRALALSDEPRRCQAVCPDPSGTLAAVTDSLGRVMIVRTTDLVVLRLLKGYRAATCAWLHAVEQWQGQWQGRPPPRTLPHGAWGAYLAVLAPRRRCIDLWRAADGAQCTPPPPPLFYVTGAPLALTPSGSLRPQGPW